MKVLLLAAGRSKRLKPIGDKNFLDFAGKPLIAHQLEQLIGIGFKDLILVGGKHNLPQIKKLAADFMKSARYVNMKVVEQKDLDEGMAGAVLSAAHLFGKDPVFIVSANDVVDAEAYKLVLRAAPDKKYDSLIVGKTVEKYFPGGYLKVKAGGLISGIVEKPGAGKEPSKMVNLVLHFHRDSTRLVKELRATKSASARDDRYEVALDRLIRAGVKMKALQYNGFWQPVKYPWHVITLMNYFLDGSGKGLQKGKNVSIAKSATIKGNVFLGDGVKVLENAVISGPAYIGKNTIIATGALVRNSQVGEDCVIGFGSEIARSYLGNGVWTHTNYIGDSVIGNNCSFGSGTVTGNLRLDEGNIQVRVNGDKVDCGSNKFGLITGDNVRCGINTSFMPGVKIGNNCFIGGGIIIAQDIEDNKYAYGKTELVIKDNLAKADPGNREELRKKMR
jgi:UDP-N-acetylglucosamine diphosphorylase / glucose-1-phosphate thymidylyltransferase / UDP-N-acetylgalactosamine diphosphorylase / glucosamine-1-phosphate N-acetyltransferase / galactosamine-1-phosphate N-acetyltransferase